MPRPRRAAARKSYADIGDGPEVETNDDLIEQPAANVCCAGSSPTYALSLEPAVATIVIHVCF